MPSHRNIVRFNPDSGYESSLYFMKFKQRLAIIIMEFLYFLTLCFWYLLDMQIGTLIAESQVSLLNSLVLEVELKVIIRRRVLASYWL